jgi:hypothetical protein
MNERDEARKVLDELTCLRIDAEPEAKEIAALLRYAARAKAAALREAADKLDARAREAADSNIAGEQWESGYKMGLVDAAEVVGVMAAKLEGGTDGL